MKRQTIDKAFIKTLDWFNNKVVDWNSAGITYNLDGTTSQLQQYHFGFTCDSSITSSNGEYVLIYLKLGTKGLLLKNGELLREINRSYYQSSVYEFPAAFIDYKGKTYLIHCPREYCMLDIEDVESGILITSIPEREPSDIFHSRLEVSQDNKYLLSKGWVWHPFDVIALFDIEQCFLDPTLLDSGISPELDGEVHTATFLNDTQVICMSEEMEYDDDKEESISCDQLSIWNLMTQEIEHTTKLGVVTGNLFPIDDKRCWDMYNHPKIIDLESGKVIVEDKTLNSGQQSSAIIHHLKDLPKIAYNKATKQIAIANDKENLIEILTP